MEKRSRVITSIIVIALFSSMLLGSNKKTSPGDDSVQNDKLWTLKWSDEFNENKVNTNNWNYEIGNGNGGWGNNELEYYTNSEKNVFIDKNDAEAKDGKLVIRAEKETLPGVAQNYTSGRITTKGKVSMKYGRLDIKAKMPVGDGLWPALWMMPVDDKYGGWAASGEIDMTEAKGRLTDRVSGTLHYGQSWPANKYTGKEFVFPQGQSINQYHVYSLEWEPGVIRWYVDGKLYQTQNNWYTKGTTGEEKYSFPAPFDQDFYIIMNLAVGGTFDNQADLTKTQYPAQMDVDYVRVYDLTGRAYNTVKEPSVMLEPLPADAKQPDADGNLLSNGDFTKPIVENPTGANDFGYDWNFVHIPDTNGNGTQSIEAIDGKNYAKVNVTAAGSQNYAVQLIQRTTMGKGRWYKLDFDAKASSDRTINAKACGGSDRGYASYSDVFTYNLGTTMKHFESTFQMTADTDLKGRVEFELGLNTSTVWIGNVSLKEIEAPVEDYNSSKTPLSDGNLIYNSAFDKGLISRMTYWNFNKTGAEAAAVVPEDTRELNVNITDGGANASAITLDQRGLQLTKDTNYQLTFKGRAVADRNIKVKVISKDGTVNYLNETSVDLSTTMDEKAVTFKMASATDLESQLVFELGGNNSSVYLDDVRLAEVTGEINLKPNLITNGNFDNNADGWSAWWGDQYSGVASGTLTQESGKLKVHLTAIGGASYAPQILQEGFKLENGKSYIASFKAKADTARKMNINIGKGLDHDPWYTAYASTQVVDVDSTEKQYTFGFTVTESTDPLLKMVFEVGNVSGGNAVTDIYLDDISITEANKDMLPSGLVITTGNDKIQNGSFTTDTSNWSSYSDGTGLTMVQDSGRLKMQMKSLGGNSWSSQVLQEGFQLENGKTYFVHFKAAAAKERNININIGKALSADPWFRPYMTNKVVKVGTTENEYCFSFTVSEATDPGLKLVFEVGNVAGGSAVTDIYLDEVSIQEVLNPSAPAKKVSITNGDFSSADLGAWDVVQNDGSALTPTVINGEAKLSLTNVGSQPWSAQFSQLGFNFDVNTQYKVAFDARSTAARNIEVIVENSSYTRHLNQIVALSTNNTHYEYTFTVPVDELVNFKFLLGKTDENVPATAHDIYLDNVVISKVASGGEAGLQ